jgi:hypothetical protein
LCGSQPAGHNAQRLHAVRPHGFERGQVAGVGVVEDLLEVLGLPLGQVVKKEREGRLAWRAKDDWLRVRLLRAEHATGSSQSLFQGFTHGHKRLVGIHRCFIFKVDRHHHLTWSVVPRMSLAAF